MIMTMIKPQPTPVLLEWAIEERKTTYSKVEGDHTHPHIDQGINS